VAGGGKTWPDGQKAWLGVKTCSWGLANGNNRANKSKIHVEKRKKNAPRAQTTCLASFGPMGVETGSWEVETRGWGWKDVARWSKCVAGGQNV
jgi:hypothetical protein